MICKNRRCKHIGANNRCTVVRNMKINENGMCASFEKGIMYYIDLVYDALDSTNMIPTSDLTQDMKIGLYYVMTIFHLGFCERNLGPWFGRVVQLKNGENESGLKAEEIVKMPLDMEALEKIIADFNKGVLPGPDTEDKQHETPKKKSQPFGWLSPSGEFTEGDFGEHEQIAFEIIEKKHFVDEFDHSSSPYDSARDFLAGAKGYALIHNPAGFGGYIVSHEKPLTKKQNDFLYGYFIDMGDSLMANRFVDDGSI